MKLSRSFLIAVCAGMIGLFSVTAAQTLQSRFLPDRQYTVVIKKTLSGFDGVQEVVPVTSTQRVTMETGSHDGNGVPVTMTIYTTVQASRQNEEREQWKFAFTANDNGSIDDIQTMSTLEDLDAKVAFSILSRQLDKIFFQSVYDLMGKERSTVRVLSQQPRDGAEEFVDLEYEIERKAMAERLRADGAPMVTEDKGVAVFHTGDQCYLERTLTEVNRIDVPMDEYGDAKNIVMNSEDRITVTVTARQ